MSRPPSRDPFRPGVRTTTAPPTVVRNMLTFDWEGDPSGFIRLDIATDGPLPTADIASNDIVIRAYGNGVAEDERSIGEIAVVPFAPGGVQINLDDFSENDIHRITITGVITFTDGSTLTANLVAQPVYLVAAGSVDSRDGEAVRLRFEFYGSPADQGTGNVNSLTGVFNNDATTPHIVGEDNEVADAVLFLKYYYSPDAGEQPNSVSINGDIHYQLYVARFVNVYVTPLKPVYQVSTIVGLYYDVGTGNGELFFDLDPVPPGPDEAKYASSDAMNKTIYAGGVYADITAARYRVEQTYGVVFLLPARPVEVTLDGAAEFRDFIINGSLSTNVPESFPG